MSIWQTKAALRFPHTARRARIFGDGQFVLAIDCGNPKILLYPDASRRQKKLIAIDRGCGYECHDKHFLLELD
jgi:hypothetical protein